MINNMLNISEVSTVIGTSTQTISTWYKFKKENPDDELAKLLPEFERIGNRKTRYWKQEDIWKLLKFKSNITYGRYGVMGSVSQRYVKTNFRNKNKED